MPKGLTPNEKKITVMCKKRAAATGNPYSVKKINGKLKCVPGAKRSPVNKKRPTEPDRNTKEIRLKERLNY